MSGYDLVDVEVTHESADDLFDRRENTANFRSHSE